MTISVFSPPVGDLALIPVWPHAGAPSNGTTGTLAGYAQKGDLLADTSGGVLYQNTGTQASPTWTSIGSGSTGFSGMTAGQVPVAASATTGTSSLPLSGSTTSAAEVVSASVAAKTSGHLATWDANGGLIDGGTVPAGISGLTTNAIPKAGSATTLVNSAISDNGTSVTITEPLVLTGQTSTPGAAAGTLTNAPAIGDPQTSLQVSINGVVHWIPAWHA